MKNLIAGIIAAVAVFFVMPAALADGTNSVAAVSPTPYPLDYCVVSGDKLGSMGPTIDFVYQDPSKGINQDIKFCCSDCKPKFLNDPDKYMAIILKAEADQAKNPPASK